MPTPTRELKITYGTTVVGTGSSVYFIDGPVAFNRGDTAASVSAEVIVIGSSEGAFRTNCTALETAFATPRQFLEVKFGSAVHETFDPVANTGFNHVPSISKVGDPTTDTGRSRRYRIAVSCQVPADLYTNTDGSSTGARQRSSVNLMKTDSNRQRLQITGTYTASAADARDSRAQYNAKITTYVTGLLTAFGGTWEGPFDPQVVTDDQDKVCNFSFIYEELAFNQSKNALDDPTLRRQKLTIVRSTDSPGDSVLFGIKPQRLQRVSVSYSVAVDKTVSQDLKGVYDSTIRPFLVAQAQSAADSANGFIESEVPAFDPVENRISAQISFVSYPGGTLLNCRITTDESESTGVSLIPIWKKDRLAKKKFTGPGTITRTITVVTREVGQPGSQSLVGQASGEDVIGGFQRNVPAGVESERDTALIGDSDGDLADAGGVPEPQQSLDGNPLTREFLGSVHSSTPLRIGPINGQTLDVVDRTVVARYEYFVRPEQLD